MTKICYWLLIKVTVLISTCNLNYVLSSEASDDSSLEAMKGDWKKCCKMNKCFPGRNSCYFVIWSYSNWQTMRQRCQNAYPGEIGSTDLVQIQHEDDIPIFWEMLHRRNYPNSIWTSGSRCAKNTEKGIMAEYLWVSSNQTFSPWLKEKFQKDIEEFSFKRKGCEYLVISPSPSVMGVKYDFQNQNAYHPAICEFILPDTRTTAESENTRETTKSSTTENEASSTSTTKTSTSSTSVRTIPSQKTPEHISSNTPIQLTETTNIQSTTNTPKYCKSIKRHGITWPDTLPGTMARLPCPKGLVGFLQWECDEETLTFRPEKPNFEECKHAWIDRLEDYIREKHDAVEISTKLAEQTKQNDMSHGDIIALVNLTSNLLTLYTEQKGEEEFEVSQNEEVPVYYNFTKTMISSISNILRTEIKDAWEGLNATRQTKEASTILKLVTTIGSRLSCIKTSDEKLQFTVSEENIDLQTFILNNTDEEDIIVFPQATKNVKPSSIIMLPANLKLPKWFSSCKTYSSAVGVIYKQVGDFLKAGKVNTTTKVATKVLGFSMSNSTTSIDLKGGKVNITLQHLFPKDISYQTERGPRCVFWNFSKSIFGAWDESGCELIDFNRTHTLCQCDHLTNFAVLMDINDNTEDNAVLTMLTYVCCGFSSFTLFLTLICFAVIRTLHGRRSIITGNLCFTLLVTNVLIIFGLDKTQNRIVCAVIAGVLHYWILSAFCWMLVEGYHLYQMVILVFQRGSNWPVKYYYIFAYGTPLIIVGISAGVRREGYGSDKNCWLSPDNGMIWSFVGPACAIILVNIVVFILTLRSASSVKIKREQSTFRKIKSWVRGSISVMCLLGLTWCIGLFYLDKKMNFFSYFFIVLNGLQGAFIFLFHILLNDKVSIYCLCSSKGKKGRAVRKFLNHTSSNPTNSKTSNRTSLNSMGCASSTKLTDTRKKSIASPPLRNYLYNGQYAVQDATNHNGASYENYRKNNISRTGSRPTPTAPELPL